MSAFPELRALRSEVDGERLELPIGDQVYRFSKSIPMKLGMALAEAREQTRAIVDALESGAEPKVPDSLENLSKDDVQRALIGDQWDRMIADGVLDTEFETVYFTLFAWHMASEQAAMAIWTGEADAGPPARSGSKARTTSLRSSSRKKSAPTKLRRSVGQTSSAAGT